MKPCDELVTMRWVRRHDRTGSPPVINIRGVTALADLAEAENRCLVLANSFAEYASEPNPETKKDVVWFAMNEDRPLFV